MGKQYGLKKRKRYIREQQLWSHPSSQHCGKQGRQSADQACVKQLQEELKPESEVHLTQSGTTEQLLVHLRSADLKTLACRFAKLKCEHLPQARGKMVSTQKDLGSQ